MTEYHFHERNDFALEVKLFGVEEIQEQVSELLKSYRHYHRHVGRMEDEDARQDAEETANLARDTFLAMFRGRLESGILLGEPEEAVLVRLASLVREVYPSAIEGVTSKATAADCSELLVRLTSEPTGAWEPAIWPFISVIRSVRLASTLCEETMTNSSQSLLESTHSEQGPGARRPPW